MRGYGASNNEPPYLRDGTSNRLQRNGHVEGPIQAVDCGWVSKAGHSQVVQVRPHADGVHRLE
jgi:hypothetical protein